MRCTQRSVAIDRASEPLRPTETNRVAFSGSDAWAGSAACTEEAATRAATNADTAVVEKEGRIVRAFAVSMASSYGRGSIRQTRTFGPDG